MLPAFRPSEMVAIGRAVEAEIGKRQGQRTDKEHPVNIPEVQGLETREIAAKSAGFASRNSYAQAKTVVDTGAPELVAAMDSGKVSISAAAVIAKQDQETQRRIVAEDNMARKAAELRAEQSLGQRLVAWWSSGVKSIKGSADLRPRRCEGSSKGQRDGPPRRFKSPRRRLIAANDNLMDAIKKASA